MGRVLVRTWMVILMCKHFIEVQDNKIINSKGKYKKGRWTFCEECGTLKVSKREAREYDKRAGRIKK